MRICIISNIPTQQKMSHAASQEDNHYTINSSFFSITAFRERVDNRHWRIAWRSQCPACNHIDTRYQLSDCVWSCSQCESTFGNEVHHQLGCSNRYCFLDAVCKDDYDVYSDSENET